MPVTFARESPHLEDVRKVACELELQQQLERIIAVIVDIEALVARSVPEAHRAIDVHGPPRNDRGALARNVRIRQVDGEQGVVVLDHRAEEQRPGSGEPQAKSRQVTRVAVVHAIYTEVADTRAFHVAKTVEDRKGIAMLQDSRAIVDAGRRR